MSRLKRSGEQLTHLLLETTEYSRFGLADGGGSHAQHVDQGAGKRPSIVVCEGDQRACDGESQNCRCLSPPGRVGPRRWTSDDPGDADQAKATTPARESPTDKHYEMH